MNTPQTKVGLLRERTAILAENRRFKSLCEQAAAQLGECALTRRINGAIYESKFNEHTNR